MLAATSATPIQAGKYRLLRLLAVGGMGEVYLARQEGPAGFARTVVIKKLLRHLSSDQGFVDLFLNEARLAALLSHPNVVQIIELGAEGDSYFIAMEYIHGKSLRAIKAELVKQGKEVPLVLTAQVLSLALRGLHYAHQLADDRGRPLGLVHRDVSPDNVLVGFDGQVKVVDFGIAKAAALSSKTRTGAVRGKVPYMSPEHISGASVDARADVFSAGVVAYEMLSGGRPFLGQSDAEVGHRIVYDLPRPLGEVRPDIPAELTELVMRAIAKSPDDRFSSAREMCSALERFVASTRQPASAEELSARMREIFGTEAARAPIEPAEPLSTQTLSTPLQPRDASAVVPNGHPQSVPLRSGRVGRSGHSRKQAAVIALGVLAIAAIATVVASSKVIRDAWGRTESTSAPAAQPPMAEPVSPVRAGTSLRTEPIASAERARGSTHQPSLSAEPRGTGKVALAVSVAPHAIAANHRLPNRPRALGKVTLHVRPWAEVFLGTQSLGITPLAPVAVPAGRQVFTLKNAELGVQKTVRILVPAGGDVTLTADLFSESSGR